MRAYAAANRTAAIPNEPRIEVDAVNDDCVMSLYQYTCSYDCKYILWWPTSPKKYVDLFGTGAGDTMLTQVIYDHRFNCADIESGSVSYPCQGVSSSRMANSDEAQDGTQAVPTGRPEVVQSPDGPLVDRRVVEHVQSVDNAEAATVPAAIREPASQQVADRQAARERVTDAIREAVGRQPGQEAEEGGN